MSVTPITDIQNEPEPLPRGPVVDKNGEVTRNYRNWFQGKDRKLGEIISGVNQTNTNIVQLETDLTFAVVTLSKPAATVFAYADGSVPDFTGADGQVSVFLGITDKTADATYSASGTGVTGTVNTADNTPVSGKPKGYYRVTAMSADIGELAITVTLDGNSYVRSFSVSKTRTGFEIVSALPTTNLFEGRIVFLETDDKLYRYTGTAWTTAVPATDITGQIVAAQIADAAINTAKFAASIEPVTLVSSVPGSKSTSSIFNTSDGFLYRWDGAAYVKTVPTTDLSGTITGSQISDAALTTAKFAAGIEPVTIVSSVPGTKSTSSLFNTTDGFLYRWNGTSYVKSVPSTDISGTLTDAQIADLAATKITGTLTDSQIADLAATKITGTLTDSQIADLAATKITGTLTDSQIADLAATKITGTLTDSQIADLAAAKLTGTIVETQIGSNAITAPKIAAGAVETAKLAAGAVTASTIAAGAIETSKLSAGAVTASTIAAGAIETAKIAAGAVTANEIGAGAITAVKIASGAVETAKLAAGAVTANEIGAGAITAVKIAAGAIETAKIAAGAVTANEIGAGAITAVKIAAGAVETAKIAAGAVTATQIAAGTITATQIASGTITANEIATNTITAGQIASGAINTDELAAGAVTAAKIAANTITASQIASSAITTDELAAGAVTAAKIAANTITAGQIASGAIATDELAAGAVTAAKIAAGTITANEIASNTITAGNIAASTITAAEIATNAITSDKILAGAVTAAKISVTSLSAMNANTGNLSVNGTLTLGSSGKLITSGTTYDTNGIFLGDDSGTYKFSIGGTSGRLTFDGTNLSLPGGRIVDGSVSAAKISVTDLSAISADLGSITAGKIALTSGSYVVRHGAGFGASSDLVLWYGLSSVSEGSATKTNGVFALATDGKVYFGTQELSQEVQSAAKEGTGSDITTSGTTWVTAVTIDMTVGASGYIEIPFIIAIADALISLSAGTTFSGNWRIMEATQAAPSTKNQLFTGTFTVTDTGFGLFTVSGFVAPSGFAQNTYSGACRYTLEIQRASGTNNVTGGGIDFDMGVKFTAGG